MSFERRVNSDRFVEVLNESREARLEELKQSSGQVSF